MQLDLIFDGRPIPNENGVYDYDEAFKITMPRTKGGASAQVAVIEAFPDVWVHAVSYMLNTRGSASPLSAYPHDLRFSTRNEAIVFGLAQLVKRMDVVQQENSSTAPSRTQIKQVRDWALSQTMKRSPERRQ